MPINPKKRSPSSPQTRPVIQTPTHRVVISKIAQSKLLICRPRRVFLRGGRELEAANDWEEALEGKAEIVVLVSAGEDYVGSRDKQSAPKEGDAAQCIIERLDAKASVDDTSITRLEATAKSLPGIIHAFAQPDLHPGTKYPIGAVFVSKGWIHLPLIGSDIGCGMAC